MYIKRVQIIIGFVWLIAIITGLLPFVIPESRYKSSSGLIIIGIGKQFFIIYGKAIWKIIFVISKKKIIFNSLCWVIFVIPLLLTWCVNFLTAKHLKIYTARLQSNVRSINRIGEEERMAKTLMLMVIAFTVAIGLCECRFKSGVVQRRSCGLSEFLEAEKPYKNSSHHNSSTACLLLFGNFLLFQTFSIGTVQWL